MAKVNLVQQQYGSRLDRAIIAGAQASFLLLTPIEISWETLKSIKKATEEKSAPEPDRDAGSGGVKPPRKRLALSFSPRPHFTKSRL